MGLVARIAVSALRRPRSHAYGDDRSQVADLHLPDGDGPFRVAVVLHGGHWSSRYGKLVTRPLALDLARRGIAAWNLEYRRLGGGGGWPMTFEDVHAGIDALADLGEPRLDLSDVSAVGHSAGGQLALYAAARNGSSAVSVSRVAALAPVTNLRATQIARELLGGHPSEVPERYAATDPLSRVPLPVPARIVHSREDSLIPVARSREYASAARAAGAEVELVETRGAHRDLIDPAHPEWESTALWLRGRG